MLGEVFLFANVIFFLHDNCISNNFYYHGSLIVTCTYIFYNKATRQLDITIKKTTEILYNISVNITVFFIWKLDISLYLNST